MCVCLRFCVCIYLGLCDSSVVLSAKGGEERVVPSEVKRTGKTPFIAMETRDPFCFY